MTDRRIEMLIDSFEKMMKHQSFLRELNGYKENDGFTRAIDRSKQMFLSNLYMQQRQQNNKQEQETRARIKALEEQNKKQETIINELQAYIKGQKIKAQIEVDTKDIEAAAREIREGIEKYF